MKNFTRSIFIKANTFITRSILLKAIFSGLLLCCFATGNAQISGASSVCVGATTTLTDGTSGGAWSSGNTAVATVASTGVVTGVAAGTAVISYSLGSPSVFTITVNPIPSVILGDSLVCGTSVNFLSDSAGAGAWSSSNGNVTVDGSGHVTGVSAGTSIITFSTGCGTVTATVLVNNLPSAGSISGATVVLPGGTITLSDATSASGWATWANMPTAMDNAAVAAYNDNIYVIGGQSGAGLFGIVQIYNATTNTWSSGAPLPGGQTRYQADNAAAINGKIYMAGGWYGGCSSNALFIYDIASNSWSNGAGMPGLSAQGITGVINGKLYVTTAAACATGYQNYLYSYDPVANSWAVLPSSPSAHANPAGGVINGKLYVAGGYNWVGGTTAVLSNQLDVYDPVANSWSTLASMPTALFTQASGIMNGKLYVAGGINSSSSKVSTLYIYDPVSNTWSTGTSMPGARGDLSGGIVNGSLYVFGGENGGPSTLTTNQSYTPYSWSSSNTAVATVDQAGNVTGIAGGTALISYNVGGGACTGSATHVVTVPGTINGPSSVCIGSNITLTDAAIGGAWISSNVSVATIGSVTGIVLGVSAGTALISYCLPGDTTTTAITVYANPPAISGTTGLCAFSTVSLTDASAGGTWSTGNSLVATVGSSSGIVSGLQTGTATIVYTDVNGCKAGTVVTINTSPSVIHGASTVCTGTFITLSNTVAGGTWSSSDGTIATIGSGFGDVIGIAPGTVTITYAIGSGCTATMVMTVIQTPSAISGPTSICTGSTLTLSDPDGGGTWSSSNIAKASIGSSSGIITGNTTGTTTVSYTLNTCSATLIMTVDQQPSPITGTNTVCEGSITALSDPTINGVWSSASTSTATVGSGDGIVFGAAAGTTTITYLMPTGCFSTATITVNALPSSISGTAVVCAGSTITLSDATGGGTWSSSSNTICTVGGTTGVVTGVSAGNATITYKLSTGCISTITATVNPLPAPITGSLTVCIGSTTALNDTTSGGVWAGAGTAGSVDASGVVTGIAAGTVTIAYIITSTGCLATKIVTVHPLPSSISGAPSVCTGRTVTLSDTPTGGTWSSSDISTATVSVGGVVTGLNPGTVTVTYQLATGCLATLLMNVNETPGTVTGISVICMGDSTILADTSVGGTWSSGSPSVGTIDVSGHFTSLSAGNTTIYYTLGSGCASAVTVNVLAVPAAISGATMLCAGSNISLSDASPGGVWSSSNTGVATINTFGGVIGLLAGTTNISYTYATGCASVITMTVNPVPSPITGPVIVCAGSAITLADTTAGGTWNTAATTVSLDGSGNVTALTAGTAKISYSFPTGCSATSVVSVLPIPAVIVGTTVICNGVTTLLTDGTPGGTWSSSDVFIANISTIGYVTGTGAGAALIYYTGSNGCVRATTVIVNPLPSAIIGDTAICTGTTTIFTDTTAGGTWSSSYSATASIGSASGLVSGILPGSVTISYTLSTGCRATSLLKVNASPRSIGGVHILCYGSAMTLTDAVSGGTWSSSDTVVAGIGGGSGIVTGLSTGTSSVTYMLASGCFVDTTISVDTIPAAIIGITNVCKGLTTTLSDTVTGGVWATGSPTIADVNTTSGVVTGINAGTTNITYILPDGCKTSIPVTVNPLPSTISGVLSACAGFTSTLSDAVPLGTWSSLNTAIATIDSTGIVTGVVAGIDIISYVLPTGCFKTATYTVNPMPSTISGDTTVCVGASFTLSDSPSGGLWSSSNGSVAIVAATTGLVTGMSGGTAIITYRFGTGCQATTLITIDPLPSPITGATRMCVGDSITLGEAAGGVWSSGDVSIASVNFSGVVTGVSNGTVRISYTLPTGCFTTAVVTVNAFPAAISGTTTVCEASTTALSDITFGGAWSSSTLGVATINTSGVVTGVTAGTSTITYMPATGCYVTTTVFVNPLPPGITGMSGICIGNTITLSDSSLGGTWSSSNIGIAAVGSGTGIVTGVSAGTAHITYTLPTGCKISAMVTVNALPITIAGTLKVCKASSVTLSDAVAGGTWSSSDTSIATVGVVSGIVVGVTPGTVIITYAFGTGCMKTATVTVNPSPSPILGTVNICTGLTYTLSDTISGGLWSTLGSGVASVGSSTGIVTGLGAGTVNITYTLSGGCRAVTAVTVNPVPTPILGTRHVCEGAVTSLSDVAPLGTWSSSAPAIAGVDLTTGYVSGMSAGTATITYMLPAGCYTTTIVTVNPSPGPILGTTSMCLGATSILTDVVTGGTWSSSSLAVATIGASSGVLSSMAAGTEIITYTLPAGCKTTTVIVVNPVPSSITGVTSVCQGLFTTLSDAVGGGIWSSSNAGVASIGSVSGVVVGVTTGTATITYTLAAGGCYKTVGIIVDPLPAAITGTQVYCAGATATLSDATTGGHWSSSNTAVATIGSNTGLLTSISGGSAMITYKLPTGCLTSTSITVNPLPAAIIGSSTACAGRTLFLSDATAGGVWHSSNNSIATIDATGNVVTINPGMDTITYTVATGCDRVVVLTVNPTPAAITGPLEVCEGSSITLSDPTPGGTWSSGNTSIATVVAGTGVVTGVSTGFTPISYKLPAGCGVAVLVTVDVSPSVISGDMHICSATTTLLTDAFAGGTWTSSAPSIASVGLVSGVLSGVSAGTATITYSLAGGCQATAVVTISALPFAGAISGPSSVCITATITLSDAVPGGVWSSSDTTILSVNPIGKVTGIDTGSATITYAVSQFCGDTFVTKHVVVDPQPYAGGITGNTSICIDAATSLNDTITGGIWSSGNNTIAIVGTSGIVTSITAGTVHISYSISNICGTAVASIIVTVNPFAVLAPIAIHPQSYMCSNTQYQNFGAGTAPASGVQYMWGEYNADIFATSPDHENALVSFPDSGTAYVTLSATVLSTGCIITDTFVAHLSSSISPEPIVEYYTNELICTDNTADNYQWGYDDAVTLDSTRIQGATFQDYYLPFPDFNNRYYWVMTLHNGCLQKSYYNSPATGVKTVVVNNMEILLYPNPADSKIFIEVKGENNLDDISVQLYDMLGKNTKGCMLVAGKGSLGVSGLASGVYSVMLIQNGIKLGATTFVKN